MFAAGLSVKYDTSVLVAKAGASKRDREKDQINLNANVNSEQELARKIQLGMRFPNAQVLNQSSARPWPFAHFLCSDGRFRLVLFAGNLQEPMQLERVKGLCRKLDSPRSFLRRFTPKGKRIDATIELLTIHSGPRTAVELLDLPDILHPFDERTGWDYDKVFADGMSYHDGHGHAYTQYGVDKERGCLVVIRPDQHVAWVGNFEDLEGADSYFSSILIPQD